MKKYRHLTVQRIREEKREKKRIFYSFFDILESWGFGRDIFRFLLFSECRRGYLVYFRIFENTVCRVFFSSVRQRGEALDEARNKEIMFKNRAVLKFPKLKPVHKSRLPVLPPNREEIKIRKSGFRKKINKKVLESNQKVKIALDRESVI